MGSGRKNGIWAIYGNERSSFFKHDCMKIKPTTPESFDGEKLDFKAMFEKSKLFEGWKKPPCRLPRKLKKKLRKMVMVETNDFSPPLRWRNIDKRYRKYLLSDPKMRFPFNAEEAKTK